MKPRFPVWIACAYALAAAVVSETALAYVGPGAGLTLLSALWGLLAAIGAVMLFVIGWPLRRWRKRVRAKREQTTRGEERVQ